MACYTYTTTTVIDTQLQAQPLAVATVRTLAAAVQRAFVSADAVGAAHAATPQVAAVLHTLSHWPDVCVAASTAAAVCSLSRQVTRLPWLEAAGAVQWLTAVAQQLAAPAIAPAATTASSTSSNSNSSSSIDKLNDVALWRVTGLHGARQRAAGCQHSSTA
jgi:hypothetical protein